MAKIEFSFLDQSFTLTDEASQSSHGEPVMVHDDHQYRAAEVVIKNHREDLGGMFPALEEPTDYTALDVMLHGAELGDDRDPYDAQANEARLDLRRRFYAQVHGRAQ